ncbi:MAG TPA: hypothetical protein VF424_15160 [Vicinamibacterales bacterium]
MKRACHCVLLAVLAAEALIVGQGPEVKKVLADVRAALGGDANLEGVKSVAVEGRLTRSMGGRSMTNDFEMAFELPDKYVKKDVMAVMGSTTIARTTGFNGEGLIEVIDTPPSMGGAMTIPRMAGPGTPGMPATPETIAAQRQALVAMNKRDFARITLGMFATSQPVFPLEFAYGGQAEAPDGKAHVIDVKGPDGFVARLFVDTKTHLPLMLSWMDKEPMKMTIGGGPAGSGTVMIGHGPGIPADHRGTPEQAAATRRMMEEQMKEMEKNRRTVEYRIFYGDYREFAGVRMPTRIQRMVDGQPTEELNLEKIKVNPKFDAKKFEVTK